MLIVTAIVGVRQELWGSAGGGIAVSWRPLLRKIFLVDLLKGLKVTFHYQPPERGHYGRSDRWSARSSEATAASPVECES